MRTIVDTAAPFDAHVSPSAHGGGTRCHNCDAPLVGPYCAECGQRHHADLDPSLRELAHEAGEELLHWDGKLVETIKLLLLAPGRLTREYLEGRRARYLSPLRLYLTCSVLFFFVMALVPRQGDLGIATTSEKTASGRVVHRELTRAERDSLSASMERKSACSSGSSTSSAASAGEIQIFCLWAYSRKCAASLASRNRWIETVNGVS